MSRRASRLVANVVTTLRRLTRPVARVEGQECLRLLVNRMFCRSNLTVPVSPPPPTPRFPGSYSANKHLGLGVNDIGAGVRLFGSPHRQTEFRKAVCAALQALEDDPGCIEADL